MLNECLPTLTILHSRPASLAADGVWSPGEGCHPDEEVVDALVGAISLREVGQHKADRLTRSDCYTVDCLAQARRPLSAGDLASAIARRRKRDSVSRCFAKNSVKRIRRCLAELGLPAKEILRTDEAAYRLDRARIRIAVEHVPD